LKSNGVDTKLKEAPSARELTKTLTQARRGGIGSSAWLRLAENFADEEQLALLIPPTIRQRAEERGRDHVIALSDTTAGTFSDTTAGTFTGTISVTCTGMRGTDVALPKAH